MNWIIQKYTRWKAVRDFRDICSRLTPGMPTDEVRVLLGEPDQIISVDEELELYFEWKFINAAGRNRNYVLQFDSNSKLESWYKELEDGTAEFELFARLRR